MIKTSRRKVDERPYNALSIDGEIHHLERVLAGEGAHSTFARTYWRDRVLQALSTPGLFPTQRERLDRLLSKIDARSLLS